MSTPLENPTAYSGDENNIPFRANCTGFKARLNPPVRRAKGLLTESTFLPRSTRQRGLPAV